MCNSISRSHSMPHLHCGHNVNATKWSFVKQSYLPLSALIQTLQNHPYLEELTLSDCDQITDKAFGQFIEFLGQLQKIQLENCTQITDRSVALLVRHCPHITWIDLTGCAQITDTALRCIANALPNLKVLFIAKCDKISDYAISYLTHRCRALNRLDISCCQKLTRLGLLEIAKHLPNLLSLGMGFCPQIAGCELACCSTRYFKSLQNLSIPRCDITDQELAIILKNCSYLNYLEIPGCSRLTRQAFQQTLPNLQYLDIRNCVQLSETDFAHIDSFCPKLIEIVY